MSFSVEYTAHSKEHALQLLDRHKPSLPFPVFDYLAVAINNLQPGGEVAAGPRSLKRYST